MALPTYQKRTTESPFSESPFKGNSFDLSTPDGLLNLARLQGGAVAAAAEELVHPERSILATVGNGFKSAFKGFIDTISIPSQVVAGILSEQYSVREAIKKDIRPSDVIFGDKTPGGTTMQKVGSFLVRTATDILTDPLTYVTFGAARGILGLSSLPKVTLGTEAAAKVGVGAGAAKALSADTGLDLYRYLKNVEAQAKGLTVAKNIEARSEVYTLAKNELDELLKA